MIKQNNTAQQSKVTIKANWTLFKKDNKKIPTINQQYTSANPSNIFGSHWNASKGGGGRQAITCKEDSSITVGQQLYFLFLPLTSFRVAHVLKRAPSDDLREWAKMFEGRQSPGILV